MEKKQFEKLIKNKSAEELHRILSRHGNRLIDLTASQVNRCINLKRKLEESN